MREVSQAELEKVCREGHTFALFVYTPLCGTCKLAKRMLTVVEAALPTARVYQLDVNLSVQVAKHWQISSVPALLLFVGGELKERHYALQSVGYLYDILRSMA